MDFNEIGKHLKSKQPRAREERINSNPSPEPPTADKKDIPDLLPLRFLQALHQGSVTIVEQMINLPSLSNPDKILLNGIRASWHEQSNTAAKLLKSAAKKCYGVNVGWAHLCLADLFIDEFKLDLAERHLSLAQQAEGHKAEQEYFLSMVELTNTRIDIKRGSYKKALLNLSSFLEKCSDSYFEGVARLFMGSLGRLYNEISLEDHRRSLEQAIEIFQKISPDRYYLALATIEYASCATEPQTALQSAHKELDELKSLGREREREYMAARIAELSDKIKGNIQTAEPKDHIKNFLLIPGAMSYIAELLPVMAASNGPILILGETGVGKTILAEAIHNHPLSPRRKGKFYRVSCPDVPDHLFSSEFFGHAKGAFTGADQKRDGYFKEAEGGTLFLDEIGDLSPESQRKLLRVLDSGEYIPLGTSKPVKTNCRIIAATNRNVDLDGDNEEIDPATGMRARREPVIRGDLLSRLTQFVIEIPSLSERKEEILPLAEVFLKAYGKDNYYLTDDARSLLLTMDYQANVRDLEFYIRGAVDLASGMNRASGNTLDRIAITADIISKIPRLKSKKSKDEAVNLKEGESIVDTDFAVDEPLIITVSPGPIDLHEELLRIQRLIVHYVVEQNNGNKTLAALNLKISYRSVLRYFGEK